MSKDALIIIPGDDESGGADWQKVMSILGAQVLKKKNVTVGKCYCPGENALHIYLLEYARLRNMVKIADAKGLIEFVTKLRQLFYEEQVVPLSAFSRTVVCGHFHCTTEKFQEFYKNAYKNIKNDESTKAILERFRKPITGEGHFIITGYTIGGHWKDHSTDLIKSLSGKTDVEEIRDRFNQLFVFLWNRAKLPLVNDLGRQLFICWQSDGKCGGKPEEMKEKAVCILEDVMSYSGRMSLTEGLELVRDSLLSSMTHEEKKKVHDALDDIRLAILNPTDLNSESF